MVPMDPMSIAASNERTIMRLAPPIDSSFGGYRCSYIVPVSTNEPFCHAIGTAASTMT